MAIKRRKIKVRKPKATPADKVARMGELIAAGHGTEEHARIYYDAIYRDMLKRLQSIAAKAEAERSWRFMDGCFMQATELYVLASILYEKFPQHAIMSDAAFDQLGLFLLKNFDKLPEDFREWYNITAIDLQAGTGHSVQTQPPIRWMVYLHTGEHLPDDAAPQVRSRKLRRGSKRGSVKAPGGGGEAPRKRLRRAKGTGRNSKTA